MAAYKPRVISLTKKPKQTFGFFLRLEQGEEGHLIRSLEMGGPAELAGMKDGDRVIRVNGTFVDGLSHSEVVELVKSSGTSVTFHIMDETTYKQAKAKGVNLSEPQNKANVVANGVAKGEQKPKLCYLVKSASGFEFSLFSSNDEDGLFMTEVSPGGVAYKAGVRAKDRLLEVNGENVEDCTHEQVVAKIKQAGNAIVFLLFDDNADKVCRSQYAKVGSRSATVKHLPHKPRIANLTKGPEGYGFMLREEPQQAGHFIKDIDRDSPAGRAALKEMDRLVAVDGKEVDNCSHEQVVDMFRQSGGECCLLVVDKETDQMYKLGKVSPIIFWEEMKDSNSPPSYTEVMNTATPAQPDEEEEEDLKPKFCRMEKAPDGYGFHLNGIQGVFGQFIKEVVKGGAADRAGLEDDDMVVEVNGVNVETSSHHEVVEMIRRSGNSLEMLVARKSVYEKLKAKGVNITRMLLGEEPKSQEPTADSPETSKKEIERPESPAKPERQRTPSVSSSSSAESIDERL
ncbi:Na(+)/H(+) exchange regulatory cofactor NHE-RF3 [Oryzias melastigma]|uniref:PDZ domain containing 1 n=2 Tax=Oryzias melastigma TaxID=30732 RepID=A0A3B3BRK4_ORYME|nr:Na(+)/H(+) exchange regulatory cofactor NHE-RF3 [Oryzias melastigma]